KSHTVAGPSAAPRSDHRRRENAMVRGQCRNVFVLGGANVWFILCSSDSGGASMRGRGSIIQRLAVVLVALLACGSSARAGDYLVDPSYAGTNGAPFGSYAGTYNSVVAALGSGGVP